ncbi:hypothetical protein [Chengkuizengella sediminis]|uniref:hypothetical protein n=1 Tax=Chengkuizengella sediminis TaxID=1885917 RepID=UPI001389707F|nr:hypothetical protein [Chengkuizengella sediminis]NDI35370.1 hypothetical protein [Chengkuizengella sediminis]
MQDQWEQFLKTKPSLIWKERMDEDDDIFTEEILNAVNETLDAYIDCLKRINSNSKEKEIMNCVKKVVLKLNDLDEEYDYFIETMEREELYEFIDKGARIAGLECDGDITEEWRDW